MKLITLGMAVALAAGSVGIAYATPVNLVSNGDFSQTTTSPTNAEQIGPDYKFGQFVKNWYGYGYTIWYPSVDQALNGCGQTQYHYTGSSDGPCSTLNAVGATLPDSSSTGTFVALDGVYNSNGTINALQSSMAQQFSNLTAGSKYTVTFYWGTTQETQANSAVKSHEQYLQVYLGDSVLSGTNNGTTTGLQGTQNTSTEDTTWGNFNGWFTGSMTFKADSSTDWLSFLSFGTPADGPPMILLTGVSVTKDVPEPPELAMFGLGLLGLGLLTVFARRRALRHNGVDGDIG